MEEGPENGEESSHSARANGLNEWMELPITAFDNTCVTWQGNDYGLPEDDTTVSKHVGDV